MATTKAATKAKLVTTKEAAGAIGLSAWGLWDNRRPGRPLESLQPCAREGRKEYYRVSDVNRAKATYAKLLRTREKARRQKAEAGK